MKSVLYLLSIELLSRLRPNKPKDVHYHLPPEPELHPSPSDNLVKSFRVSKFRKAQVIHHPYCSALHVLAEKETIAGEHHSRAAACLVMSCSAPRSRVLPESCWLWYSACLTVLPVRPAMAPPTAPVKRSAPPEARSLSCPRASCSWPARFCSRPDCLRD